jgi:hypothetical protein
MTSGRLGIGGGSRSAPVLVRSAACSLATGHVAPDTAAAALKTVG